MSEEFVMRPIGHVRSCFGEKFGTPRQSGIVPSAEGEIVFMEEVDASACRGLEEFSHVWLMFLFDQVSEDDVRWMVRPPRLGGNEKKGVLATRSPFRPNRIGLSLVKLEGVESKVLKVSGLDLVDGTPILDVKPYLPYVEAVEGAVGGFAGDAPEAIPVDFPEELAQCLSEDEMRVIREVLAIDPRPAYHDDDERVYGCRLLNRDVRWRVREGRVQVVSLDA